MRVRWLLFLVLVTTPAGLAQEEPDPETVEEFKRYLIVSGWTQHLRIPAGEDINSFIAGLGYRQEFLHENGRTWSFYGGFYNDSRHVVSTNVGVECYIQWDWFDLGLTGGLMCNPRFRELAGTPVLPYGLPFLQKVIDGAVLRLYYAPPIPNHEYTEQFIFQMQFQL